ncbi:aminotransferase class V-fold PLP-dependent enzyme [Microbacterium sp.]|uniref:aminotransferase class V-fold PLP-dependent enzyme n=1 Tax=Microbacterium sp. TaxID=51671 RepID=UPI002810C9BD|nr:aminotransferase class V-fold PLP-dependent enzyme [Microbacterium sp.]
MSAFDDYVASFGDEPGYLNWAAFGPLSPAVRAETALDADLLGGMRPSAHALVGERGVQAREAVADLLGARTDEVTLQPSSTHGLMQALFGLSGTVIAATGEFPSISLTLDRAAHASRGALVARWVTPDEGQVTPDAVVAALDDDVTALAVSHVDFRTGYRADLGALRDVLGPDRLLIVDAVQSFGVVDDDYAAADVVVGHGYKWLRAGRGTGFARFSDRARERIVPVLSGITGTAADGVYADERPAPASDARAFTVSAPDPIAAGRLEVAVREVQDAGVAAIQERIADRVGEIIRIADRHGIRVASPRGSAWRAGIVSLLPVEPGHLAAELVNAGVAVTARGHAVRVSAHAGTDDETLRMLDDAIAAFRNETFTIG